MKLSIQTPFILFVIVTVTSCTGIDGNAGTMLIYAALFVLLLATLWFINNRRKRAKNENSSVTLFNNNIQNILAKLDTPEEKIKALEYTFQRVESNQEYDKNRAWKDSLLITIYLHMVVAYNEQGNDRMVLETCDNILALNPKHALTYYNRGYIYNKIGQKDKAVNDLEKYLTLDTDDKWRVKADAENILSEIKNDLDQ